MENKREEIFSAYSSDLTKYGLAEGIILFNIRFWINKNKANNKHFYDGKYWTYNSVSAFSKLFPFLSKNKIQRALKNLESKGILLVGNYNKVNYDRTKWFSINEENDLKLNNDTIHQNQQMHSSNLTNPFGENDEPIPYINTDINTDNILSEKDLKNNIHLSIPNLEEIRNYVKEKNLNVVPEDFFNFFEANNWVDSRGKKVICWKQKILTWNRFCSKNNNTNNPIKTDKYEHLKTITKENYIPGSLTYTECMKMFEIDIDNCRFWSLEADKVYNGEYRKG